jgi:hypothetical protein
MPVVHQEFFMTYGFDINDGANGRWVEGGPFGPHQKWSHQFNAEWSEFITKEPSGGYAREGVREKMLEMRARYPSEGGWPP